MTKEGDSERPSESSSIHEVTVVHDASGSPAIIRIRHSRREREIQVTYHERLRQETGEEAGFCDEESCWTSPRQRHDYI